ncbi:ribonuclease D [Adlercreutzia aquisgranensis]|uniref:ribonuclease D n=1 Tax=Adlercreutzia aquisgranensis TaxID=2941323 RepID=UPI00204011DF|nr:ribonuclease D [Adlercreutzia aquisgranensis]
MLYIADQSSFAAFCERSRSAEVLAIDTEFLREKTYYAKLCLLQLATDDEVAVVDPFALRTLDDLVPLLQDPGCTKLFHSGTQDIEILYRETGALPVGVFDTQVAAALLGHTQQIGYGALVHDVCGVTIRKLDSFTDWSRRPLAKSQIEYASEDVIYLPRMYRAMRERLVELGRLEWLAPDFQELVDPKRFEAGERERYKRLKRANQLSQRQLAGAREFAAWREVTAQTRNLPRKWVATDEQIVEACKREARTIDDLFMVRGLSGKLSTAEARTVARLMAQAFDSDPSTWPKLDRSGRSEPNVDFQIDLMTALVRLRAKQNGVAFQTLASHDDMVRVARGYRDDVDLLRGWRRSLVGEELVDLVEGRLSLSLNGQRLEVHRL